MQRIDIWRPGAGRGEWSGLSSMPPENSEENYVLSSLAFKGQPKKKVMSKLNHGKKKKKKSKGLWTNQDKEMLILI